jgi:hypothetical protein
MKQKRVKPLLIRTPGRAWISFCLAASLAAWHFWLALARTPERSFWTFPFYPLPSFGTLTSLHLTYLVCVSLFVCLLATICRYSERSERVFLAAWMAAWTLTPLKYLVPISTATVIEGIQAAGMLVASIAALNMLKRIWVRPAA